jgi:hypothetical protein
MTSLPYLAMVAAILFFAALWFNPKKQLPSLLGGSPLPELAPPPSPEPVSVEPIRRISARDEVLEEDIEIIASHLRKEEADQRYRRAMERLEAIKGNG